jgi:hypothetical protein
MSTIGIEIEPSTECDLNEPIYCSIKIDKHPPFVKPVL